MKYIKQLAIILFVTFISEALNFWIPLPVPASIYGMILLFIALKTKLIKVEQVKDVGKFLIDIMPLLFVPAAVGLMDSWNALGNVYVQIMITVLATTFIVMAAAGKVTQAVIRREAKKRG